MLISREQSRRMTSTGALEENCRIQSISQVKVQSGNTIDTTRTSQESGHSQHCGSSDRGLTPAEAERDLWPPWAATTQCAHPARLRGPAAGSRRQRTFRDIYRLWALITGASDDIGAGPPRWFHRHRAQR
jgi:hypothetical protein